MLEREFNAQTKTISVREVNDDHYEERKYWVFADYNEAVNQKIRERYTESQEFAILRQRDEKPDEYREYYEYCESCKDYVKNQKSKFE